MSGTSPNLPDQPSDAGWRHALRQPLVWFLLAVTVVRLLVAARMPLSADEAYYRVWAHALAPGYLDHPPMVALWIRAGIFLAGDTPLGIRLLAPLAVLLGSVLLMQAGRDLAALSGRAGHLAATRAAWLLNGTLLLNAGAVLITPDTPLLLFWTAALAALARLLRTGNQAWWLAAGAAAGLAVTSKYTAILLAPALLVWLLAVPTLRPWLRRPHPWVAAFIAACIVSPVLAWNAAHHWASFAKQGGRTGDWHPALALRYLAELLAGQIGLATPLLFALFAAGVWRCIARGAWRRPVTGLLAATTLVPLLVFLQHALGDRVQANWLAILYPSLALAAALTTARWWRTATGLGLALSGLLFLQAAEAPFALPRRLDFTLIRLAGWDDLAQAAESARAAAHADCIAADEYGLAAELAYHLATPVLGVEPRWALFSLPAAPAACATTLLVRSTRRTGRLPYAAMPAGQAVRARAGITAESYIFYRAFVPGGAVLLPSGK
jgi:4-amino-4-deoxy-L-arabinose transferase-like glycosyltransferase